ncbi:hypothetical protein SI65_02783 [Aspergillus cristatus]|uniref:Enoyl reductase (ER) domain-containing protein n=1 Tax=Aspergillus cristatus TaxID=573508 RepID=A0A1E3BLX9_ASPCR|nr:hypothetical protein SI65_02783 [Aspergillus cristatus]
MDSNKALIFKNIPQGLPVPGEDPTVESVARTEAPKNGLLIKSLYASFDPYMRGRMRPAELKSYSPPFHLSKPIDAFGIGKVLKSNNDSYKEDQLIIGELPIQEYVALDENSTARIRSLENPLGLDIRVFLGALGMPGLTAYSSFYEIGKPKKDDTIFISAASGAVGQLGFDAGFNYKSEKPRDALARLAPQGLNIYYDNVGGEHLEAALDAMNDFGRVVACGMIPDLNGGVYPISNLHNVIRRRISIRGFIVSDPGFADKYFLEHQNKMQRWIKEGSIKTLVCRTH